jgi:hypothetical protein
MLGAQFVRRFALSCWSPRFASLCAYRQHAHLPPPGRSLLGHRALFVSHHLRRTPLCVRQLGIPYLQLVHGLNTSSVRTCDGLVLVLDDRQHLRVRLASSLRGSDTEPAPATRSPLVSADVGPSRAPVRSGLSRTPTIGTSTQSATSLTGRYSRKSVNSVGAPGCTEQASSSPQVSWASPCVRFRP